MNRNNIVVKSLALSLSASLSSLASSGVGNGGYVVICPDQTIELADFMEARTEWGFDINLGDNSLSIDQKIEIGLKRLERLDPPRANKYRDFITSFETEARRATGVKVMPTRDANLRFVPNDCDLVNLVSQKPPRNVDERRYGINQDLWLRIEALPNGKDLLAGMKLHEVILRDAITLGHTDSDGTRYLNALISSKQIEGLTKDEYYLRVKGAGLSNNPIQIKQVEDAARFFGQLAPVYIAAAPEFREIVDRAESRRSTDEEDRGLVDLYRRVRDQYLEARRIIGDLTSSEKIELGLLDAEREKDILKTANTRIGGLILPLPNFFPPTQQEHLRNAVLYFTTIGYMGNAGPRFRANVARIDELIRKSKTGNGDGLDIAEKNELLFFHNALRDFDSYVQPLGRPVMGPEGILFQRYSSGYSEEAKEGAGIITHEHRMFIGENEFEISKGSLVHLSNGKPYSFSAKAFTKILNGKATILSGSIELSRDEDAKILKAQLAHDTKISFGDYSLDFKAGDQISIKDGRITGQRTFNYGSRAYRVLAVDGNFYDTEQYELSFLDDGSVANIYVPSKTDFEMKIGKRKLLVTGKILFDPETRTVSSAQLANPLTPRDRKYKGTLSIRIGGKSYEIGPLGIFGDPSTFHPNGEFKSTTIKVKNNFVRVNFDEQGRRL